MEDRRERPQYTISEFCILERISRSKLYEDWGAGKGPRFYYNGKVPPHPTTRRESNGGADVKPKLPLLKPPSPPATRRPPPDSRRRPSPGGAFVSGLSRSQDSAAYARQPTGSQGPRRGKGYGCQVISH